MRTSSLRAWALEQIKEGRIRRSPEADKVKLNQTNKKGNKDQRQELALEKLEDSSRKSGKAVTSNLCKYTVDLNNKKKERKQERERKKERKRQTRGQMYVLHRLSLWAAAGEILDRWQRSVGLFRGHFFMRLDLIFPGKIWLRTCSPDHAGAGDGGSGTLVDAAFTCLIVGSTEPPPDSHRSIIGWLRLIASLPKGINEEGGFFFFLFFNAFNTTRSAVSQASTYEDRVSLPMKSRMEAGIFYLLDSYKWV